MLLLLSNRTRTHPTSASARMGRHEDFGLRTSNWRRNETLCIDPPSYLQISLRPPSLCLHDFCQRATAARAHTRRKQSGSRYARRQPTSIATAYSGVDDKLSRTHPPFAAPLAPELDALPCPPLRSSSVVKMFGTATLLFAASARHVPPNTCPQQGFSAGCGSIDPPVDAQRERGGDTPEAEALSLLGARPNASLPSVSPRTNSDALGPASVLVSLCARSTCIDSHEKAQSTSTARHTARSAGLQ